MRKAFSFFLIAVILIIAAFSNPKEAQHREFVKNELRAIMEAKMDKDSIGKDGLGELVLGLGKLLGSAVIDGVVDQLVFSDDYLLFSLTRMRHQGKEEIVGLGIFGNIILFKDLETALEEGWLNELKAE